MKPIHLENQARKRVALRLPLRKTDAKLAPAPQLHKTSAKNRHYPISFIVLAFRFVGEFCKYYLHRMCSNAKGKYSLEYLLRPHGLQLQSMIKA
jgi:hypothetical protein